MSEPLDFPKLESAYWRAMCRHEMTELEMVLAATIVRLSFVIGEPFLRLDYQIELARQTGMHKSQLKPIVTRLRKGRAIEVSADGLIYTPLPPSRAWPWLFAERVDPRQADEQERGIVWAAKGPQQGEMFAPPVEQEFAAALAIERMRAALLDLHQAAASRPFGNSSFSATDRLPTPAPVPHGELSSREGPTRPLETEGRGNSSSSDSLRIEPEEASEMPAPRNDSVPKPDVPEDPTRFTNHEPGSRILNSPLKTLKDSKEAKALSTFKALKGEFTNREPLEPLDPGATEADMMAWLDEAFGGMCGPCFDARRKCQCAKPQLVPVMDRLGGWWRLRIRESRWAALNVCMELRLRLTDPHLKPLRNRGGWARDKYFEIRGEEAALKSAKTAN